MHWEREREGERESRWECKRASSLVRRCTICQIDKFHSDTEAKFRGASLLLHQSPQPSACLHLYYGRHRLVSLILHPSHKPPTPLALPPPSFCLHNATLAEDGKEGTHSFRIPPDPTAGSCSWVYHSKQRGRNKPGQPHSSDCTRRNRFRGRIQKWLQNLRGGVRHAEVTESAFGRHCRRDCAPRNLQSPVPP